MSRADASIADLLAFADDAGLTPREREVARLLALGVEPYHIADRLQIGRTAVYVHRSHIKSKLARVARKQE